MTKGKVRIRGLARQALVFTAIAFLAIALGGCVSTSSARPKTEPGIIAVRNSTGDTLAAVRIEDAQPPDGGARRLGEMSPVMPDFTHVFARSELAPALPPRVKVQWRDGSGRDQSAIVDIRQVLKQARGGADEALLFEIMPGGKVQARIETAQSSP